MTTRRPTVNYFLGWGRTIPLDRRPTTIPCGRVTPPRWPSDHPGITLGSPWHRSPWDHPGRPSLPGGPGRPIPHGTHVRAVACIMGAYRAIDRGGEEPGPVMARNPCADNVRYHDNGAGSAVSRPRASQAQACAVQALERASVRPTTPRGGAGGSRTYMYR